jgi:hypothetical protein
MKAHAVRGSEFGLDPGLLQRDGVVAGYGYLVAMRKVRAIAGRTVDSCAGFELKVVCSGHQQEIQHVDTACTTEVCVVETEDCLVVVVIARAVGCAIESQSRTPGSTELASLAGPDKNG